MGFVDLTGRHEVTHYGTPIVHADGGAWGMGYTEFEGTGYLLIADPAYDFDFGTNYCVELEVLVNPDGSVAAAGGDSAILDNVRAYGTDRWGLYDNGYGQSMQDSFVYPYSGATPGWHSIKLDVQGTTTRKYLDDVLVETTTGDLARRSAGLLAVACYYNGTAYPTIVSISAIRITRASRFGMPRLSPDQVGADDPLWSDTVLFLPLWSGAPTQRTTIDSMTADTAPGGDWTTYDGSAGRVVSGSISAALADGQSVTVSFDGGATWATATTSGLSWSIIDPGEHVTSWIIVARVSAGSQSGPVTVRSVSLVPPPAEIENPYPPLVTSEHAVRPRFMATVEALTRPLVRAQSLIAAMPAAFDLDAAEGVQLDAVGLWVGRSRYLSIPISGAWFSFDTSGLGFDEGTWKGPFDATTGISRLDDGPYRLLLKARIAANQWDGTRQGAVDAWSVMFDGTGVTFQIQDNGDMSMDVLVSTDHPLDAVTTALITGGYLGIKPSGVTINSYTITEV